MMRTTLIMPFPLRQGLLAEAKEMEMSFGELVRQVLQKYLVTKANPKDHDPFLVNHTVFDDQGPTNVSENHDEYLMTIKGKR